MEDVAFDVAGFHLSFQYHLRTSLSGLPQICVPVPPATSEAQATQTCAATIPIRQPHHECYAQTKSGRDGGSSPDSVWRLVVNEEEEGRSSEGCVVVAQEPEQEQDTSSFESVFELPEMRDRTYSDEEMERLLMGTGNVAAYEDEGLGGTKIYDISYFL